MLGVSLEDVNFKFQLIKECNSLANIFSFWRTKPTSYGLSDYILALISALFQYNKY